MDEDDAPSPASESHSPPPPPPPPPPQRSPPPLSSSNQITVTVAAAPPSNALTLAHPIQQLSRISATGGREDCWSEGATSVLIDAWGERYMELSRGNLKQKHWKEVADIVSSRQDYSKAPKTDIQCKNRIDTVKKKYKIEKAKVSGGNGPSRWPFFDRLDRLISPSVSAALTATPVKCVGFGATVCSNAGSTLSKSVPVGIPVGVRQQPQPVPLPFSPHYVQTPPHLPSPQQMLREQMQRLRPNFNFASPPPMSQLRNSSNINATNSGGGVGGVSNVIYNMDSAVLAQLRAHGKQMAMAAEQQEQLRRNPHPPKEDSDSNPDEWSNDSGDSYPPKRRGFDNRKRARVIEVGLSKRGEEGVNVNVNVKGKKNNKKGKEKKGGGAMRNWGSSVRDLTMAILKFGEAYEAAESKKLQHIKEMELQRMKFAKELELQRMKFMMKTQLELSQLNGNGDGNGNGSNNNSDSRGGGSGGDVGGESNHHHHHNHHHNHHIHENHINHSNSDSSN